MKHKNKKISGVKPLLEALEPRLLLSADFMPTALQSPGEYGGFLFTRSLLAEALEFDRTRSQTGSAGDVSFGVGRDVLGLDGASRVLSSVRPIEVGGRGGSGRVDGAGARLGSIGSQFDRGADPFDQRFPQGPNLSPSVLPPDTQNVQGPSDQNPDGPRNPWGDLFPNDFTNPPATNAPDLRVVRAAVSGAARTNEPVLVEWSVRNEGNATTTSQGWRDDVWFSRDGTLSPRSDVYLGSWWTGPFLPLDSGEQYTFKRYVVLPDEALGSGHLIFVANSGSRQIENASSNNTRAVPVSVTPGTSRPGDVDIIQTDLGSAIPVTLSATQAQAISLGLASLAGWATDVSALGEFGGDLPRVSIGGEAASAAGLVGQTGSDLGLGAFIRSSLADPFAQFIAGNPTPSSDAVEAFFRSLAGTTASEGGLLAGSFGSEIAFAVTFVQSRPGQAVSFDLSGTLADPDARIDSSASLTSSALVQGTLEFGIDLDEILTDSAGTPLPLDQWLPQAFFLRAPSALQAGVGVQATDLTLPVEFGFFEAQATGGTVQLATSFNIAANNLAGDLRGTVPLSLLTGTSPADSASVQTQSATLAITLPVTGSLGSYTIQEQGLPSATLSLVSANVFGSSTSVYSGAGFNDDAGLFSNVDALQAVGLLRELAATLNTLSSTSAFAGAIPFLDGLRVGDAINLGQAFADGALRFIESEPGVPSFTTAQGLVRALSQSIGVQPEALTPGYDIATNELTFRLQFDRQLPALPPQNVSFDLDLGAIDHLQATQGAVTITSTGRIDLVFGIDLTPLGTGAPLFTALTLLASLNGSRGVRGPSQYEQDTIDGGTVTLEPAGLPQFRVATRGAGSFDVNITGVSTVQDVIDRVSTATGGVVSVEVDPAGYRLRLVDSSTGGGVFSVTPLNNSAASLDLGIAGSDGDGDGVLNGQALHGDTLAKRSFIRQASLGGSVSIAASGTAVDGTLGFLDISASSLTLNAQATYAAQVIEPGQLSGGGTISLEALANGLAEVESLLTVPTEVASGTLVLNGVASDGAFVSGLGSMPSVTLSMPNVRDAASFVTSFNADALPLEPFVKTTRAQAVQALRGTLALLREAYGAPTYTTDLPIVGRSVVELLSVPAGKGRTTSFLDTLEQWIDTAEAAGPRSFQSFDTALDTAIGAQGAAAFGYDGASRLVTINLDADILYATMVGLDADVSSLGVSAVTSLTDTGDDGQVNVQSSAGYRLRMGVDVSGAGPARAVVLDTTRVEVGVRASGVGMRFTSTVGSSAVFVGNPDAGAPAGQLATASLSATGNASAPATFVLTLSPVAGGQYSIDAVTAANTLSSVSGEARATLPLFQRGSGGAIAPIDAMTPNLVITITDLANVGGSTTISGPDLGAFVQGSNPGNDSSGLVDGLNGFVGNVDSLLTEQLLNSNLPLVGDSLGEVVDIFRDIRPVIQALYTELTTASLTSSIISNVIFNLLGPGGANVLRDSFGPGSDGPDGQITADDVRITTQTTLGIISGLQVDFSLGGTQTISTGIAFDLGIPAIGFEIDGDIALTFDYKLDLSFGVNKDVGFYINAAGENELVLDVFASIPGLVATGRLGFLQLTATDNADTPTRVGAMFNLDLVAPQGSNGLITFANISQLSLGETLVPSVVGGANVNLDLVLSIPPYLGTPAVFPTIETNFLLDWEITWDRENGFNASPSPVLTFNDVRLNMGEFLTNVARPVVEQIAGVIAPLRPILDMLVTPLPVVSSASGRDTTILDLASQVRGTGTGLAFLRATAQIVRFLATPGLFGTGSSGQYFINFGSFTIGGGTGSGNGASEVDLRMMSDTSDIAIDTSQAMNPDSQLMDPNNPGRQLVSSYRSLDGRGFRFPLIESPLDVFKLFLGQNATLFEYTTPKLTLGFGLSFTYPILGPVSAVFGVGFDIAAQFTFGFDTFGFRQFQAQNFATSAIPLIFNGFYVSDVDARGNDVAEVTLTGRITLGVQLGVSYPGASIAVGVEGGIFATLSADLEGDYDDGDGDETRVRIQTFIDLGPDAIILRGELTARITAFVKVELGPITLYDQRWTLASIVILSFEIGGTGPLASLNNGVLTLNPENYRHFLVTEKADGTFEVRSGKERATYSGVTRIVLEGTEQSDGLRIAGEQGVIVSAAVTFNGRGGNDSLMYAGVGQVIATGGAESDVLVSGGGNDSLDGGDGTDTLESGAGDDYLVGGAGNDSLIAGAGSDILFGDSVPVGITGRSDFTVVNGLPAVPAPIAGGVLSTGAGDGNDTLDSGEDGSVDWLFGAGGADDLSGGGGNDHVDAGAGDNRARGGAGDDRILAGSGADFAAGGRGNDVILVGDGANTVYGGTEESNGSTNTGNDTIVTGDQQDFVDGGDGNDTITSAAGDDVLIGGLGSDIISAGDGNDRVYAGFETGIADASANTLSGGGGLDLLVGDNGPDLIYGHSAAYNPQADSDGADIIITNNGANEAYGQGGDDTIVGGEQADFLSGGAGDDSIDGNGGRDILFGGDAAFPNQALPVTNNIPGVPAAFQDGVPGAATDGRNRISGGADIDWIFGGGGDDTISGDAEADYLDGGGGDDLVVGGQGSDVILGGEGQDSLFAGFNTLGGDLATETNVIRAQGGADLIWGGNGNDVIDGGEGVDIIIGGRGSDTIQGGGGGDIIYSGFSIAGDGGPTDVNIVDGGAGNDIVWGDVGNDILQGGDDDDSIYGIAGNDTLYGGAGADRLEGGSGTDQLFGGSGPDVLVLFTLLTSNVSGLNYQGNGPQNAQGTPSPVDDNADTDVLLINGTPANDIITLGRVPGSPANSPLLRISINGFTVDGTWRAADGTPFIEQFQIDVGGGNNIVRFLQGADALDVSRLIARSTSVMVSIIRGGLGRDVLVGSPGRDLIVGGLDDDFIFGAGGDDRLWGDQSNNTANAADGNDFIYTGTGNDDALSQGGNDTLFAGARSVESNLIANASLLLAGQLQGIDLVGANQTAGLSTAEQQGLNRLHGGTGDDSLYGGLGVDFMYGGDNPAAEADTLYDRNNQRFIDSGSGDGWVEYARNLERVWYFEGTDETDIFRLDYVTTGAFANTHVISRRTGAAFEIVFNFSINARRPADLLPVWNDPAAVAGQSGLEAFSTLFQSLVAGDADFDVIILSARGGNDQVFVNPNVRKTVWTDGGAGNDFINHMDLPPGTAPIFTYVDSNGVTVNLGDTRRDVLVGGEGNDVLSGSVGEDWIFGGGGDDTLTGGLDRQRFDLLFGNAGNDVYQIIPDDDAQFPEADAFFGGAGIDQTLFYGVHVRPDGRPGVGVRDYITATFVAPQGLNPGFYLVGALVKDVTLNPGNNQFVRQGPSGGNYLQRFARFSAQGTEHLVFDTADGNDWVYLNPNNTFNGRAWGLSRESRPQGATIPNIQIRGGDGEDYLFGSDLAERILGGSGNDYINAFGGDDVIDGESGADFLIGDRVIDSSGVTVNSTASLPNVPAPFVVPTVPNPATAAVSTPQYYQYAISPWDPAFIDDELPAVAEIPETSFAPPSGAPVVLLSDPAGSFLTQEGFASTNGYALFDGSQSGYNPADFAITPGTAERWFTFTTQGDGSATLPGVESFSATRSGNIIRLSPDQFVRSVRADLRGGYTAAGNPPTAVNETSIIDFGNLGAQADRYAHLIVDLSTLLGDESALTSAVLTLALQQLSSTATTLRVFALSQEPGTLVESSFHTAATSPVGGGAPVASIALTATPGLKNLNIDITQAVRTALESGRGRLALRFEEFGTTNGDLSIENFGRSGAANSTYVTLNTGRGGVVADLWSSTQSAGSAPLFSGVTTIDMRSLQAGSYYMRVRPGVPLLRGPVVNPDNGNTYYALQAMNWRAAEGWARLLGGNLVTIGGPAENAFVVNALNAWGLPDIAIGFNDLSVEGTFTWSSTETPGAFTNWRAGEPNNAGNEDVAVLAASDGRWNDIPISIAVPAMVEVAAGATTPAAPTFASGPIVNPSTGSTYYLLSPTNWFTARSVARALGGDLVTIEDAAENTFVYNSIVQPRNLPSAFIGLNDVDVEANTNGAAFTWSSGSTATYRNFFLGEPNNGAGSNQDAGHIYGPSTGVGGTWDDIQTTSVLHAIIEIPLGASIGRPERFEIEITPPSRFAAQPKTFADTIIGGEGADTIIGGPGRDVIRGGFAGSADNATNIFIAELTEINDFQAGIDRGAFLPTVSQELILNEPQPLDTDFAFTSDVFRQALGLLGPLGNGAALYPEISGDGRWIVFASDANNLVAGDTNNVRDVFIYNRLTGAIERVSIADNESQSNGASAIPMVGEQLPLQQLDISDDGRYVVFVSNATNLTGGLEVGARNIFVRDRQAGTTRLVSVEEDGTGLVSSQSLLGLAISGNGRYVAFASNGNFTTDNPSALDQVYVRDLIGNTTALVSRDVSGAPLEGPGSPARAVAAPDISFDGRIVVFQTGSQILFPGGQATANFVYGVDRDTDNDGVFDEAASIDTFAVPGGNPADPRGSDEYLAPAVSSNGRRISYVSRFSGDLNVYARDYNPANGTLGPIILISRRADGSQPSGSGGGESFRAVLSADGRYAAFRSTTDGLVTGVTADGVFVRDLTLNTTQFASADSAGGPPNNNDSDYGSISSDGSFVAFQSAATDLVSGDSNGQIDVFFRDRAAQVTRLVRSVSTIRQSQLATIRRLDLTSTGLNTLALAIGTSSELNDLRGFIGLQQLSLASNPGATDILRVAYNSANGNSYLLLSPRDWNASRTRALALGGDLVTINDAAENSFILNNVLQNTGSAWIGLNDRAVEGSFVWASTGTNVPTFRNWASGEPNNSGGNQDAAIMYPLSFSPGQWDDLQETASGIYAVVEIPGPAANSTNFAIRDLASLPLNSLSLFNNSALPVQNIGAGAPNVLPASRTIRNLDIDFLNASGQTSLNLSSLGIVPSGNNLRNLSAAGMGFTGVSLAGAPNLRTLDLSRNSLSDVSGVTALSSLASVNLQGNPLSSAALTTQIPSLQARNPAVGVYYGTSPSNADVLRPRVRFFGVLDADGQTIGPAALNANPRTLSIEFDQPVFSTPSAFSLSGPFGAVVSPLTVSGFGTRTIRVGLPNLTIPGPYTLAIAVAQITDEAGNAPTATGVTQSLLLNFDYATVAPTAQISFQSPSPTITSENAAVELTWLPGGTAPIDAATVTAGDFVLRDAAGVPIAGVQPVSVTALGGNRFRYTLSGTLAAGSYQVFLTQGAVRDTAGNASVGGLLGTFTVDRTAPTATLTTPSADAFVNTLGATNAIRITYADANLAPSTFGTNDITVSGRTVIGFTNLGNGVVEYRLDAPPNQGLVIVSINAGTVTDLAGNAVEAGPLASFRYDTTRPTVLTIAPFSASFPVSQDEGFFDVTFLEAVPGIDLSSLSPDNFILTGVDIDRVEFLSPLNDLQTVRYHYADDGDRLPQGSGTISTNQASPVRDRAGNALVPFSTTFAFDSVRPTASLSLAALGGQRFALPNSINSVDILWTDSGGDIAVETIDPSDIQVSFNGVIVPIITVNNAGPGLYRYSFAPIAGEGLLQVRTIAEQVADNADNPNLAQDLGSIRVTGVLPAFQLEQPLALAYVNQSPPAVDVRVTHPFGMGLAPNQVQASDFTIGGVAASAVQDLGDGRFRLTPGAPLPEGEVRVELVGVVRDIFLREITTGIVGRFFVDRAGPAAQIVGGSTPTIDAGFIDLAWTDAGIGIDPASVSTDDLAITGVTIDRVQALGDGVYRYFYADDGDALTPGASITVSTLAGAVRDLAGNLSAGQSLANFIFQPVEAGARITNVAVNNGLANRSTLFSIALTFDRDTNLASLVGSGLVADVVQVVQTAGAAPGSAIIDAANYTWNATTRTLTIDLSVDGPDGASRQSLLTTGRYEVRLARSFIRDTQGNALRADPGAPSDPFVRVDRSTAALSQDFFMLTGDLNGDARVNSIDYTLLLAGFNSTSFASDVNGDGRVNALDFTLLTGSLGSSLA